MNQTDVSFLVLLLSCGLAGGLIGYGDVGTLQAACKGAGLGLIIPIIYIVLFGVF